MGRIRAKGVAKPFSKQKTTTGKTLVSVFGWVQGQGLMGCQKHVALSRVVVVCNGGYV